jgi:hypothetical protein
MTRSEAGIDLYHSDSVIAWLLARSGFSMEEVRPPAGGRAPGWEAGLVLARRREAAQDVGRVTSSIEVSW